MPSSDAAPHQLADSASVFPTEELIDPARPPGSVPAWAGFFIPGNYRDGWNGSWSQVLTRAREGMGRKSERVRVSLRMGEWREHGSRFAWTGQALSGSSVKVELEDGFQGGVKLLQFKPRY